MNSSEAYPSRNRQEYQNNPEELGPEIKTVVLGGGEKMSLIMKMEDQSTHAPA